MAYPERLLSPDEEIVTEFRPHWRSILFPIVIGDLIIIAGIVIGVVSDQLAWSLLGAVVLALAIVAAPLVRWFYTKYVITTERIIVRSGVFSRAGKEIPLEVINDAAFSQRLSERIFRSGDLLLESAGELGQSRFSDIPDPEAVQSMIYRLREDRMMALNSRSSASEDLAALAKLHADGILTDEEFAEKKQKLLGEI